MRVPAACILLVGSGLGCAGFSRSSNTSGNSSGQSANSSGASEGTSQNSSASSAPSSDQSRNSATSVQSSLDSSNASSGSSGASSSIVAGSALLLGAAGGIITTVFTVKNRREARLQREQLKQLQQAPQPQPIPLQPQSSRLEDEPTLDAMVMARSWLMANRLQLAQDLALGAGPAVDDLAWISGIAPAHRAHFGKLLQRHRKQLLVGTEVSPQQAAEVMARVGDLVMADPTLRIDAGAMLAAW